MGRIENFSEFDENYNPEDTTSLVNFKHKKHNETYTRHTTIKSLKSTDKEKILEAARKKGYRETKAMGASRKWRNILKFWKNPCQPGILYPKK
jgi:hypothetical protein